jgi:hypothetical protein
MRFIASSPAGDPVTPELAFRSLKGALQCTPPRCACKLQEKYKPLRRYPIELPNKNEKKHLGITRAVTLHDEQHQAMSLIPCTSLALGFGSFANEKTRRAGRAETHFSILSKI